MTRTLKLNLKSEFRKLLSHIRQRVKDYPIYVNHGPGEGEDDISLITLGYSYDESGSWYALVLDTRPEAKPDGQWQAFIEDNWVTQFEWNLENAEMVDVKHYDPSWQEPPSMTEKRFAKLLGDLCRDALLAARDKRLFAKLPLSDNCVLSVEEHEGRYGWPNFKQRRKAGRAII